MVDAEGESNHPDKNLDITKELLIKGKYYGWGFISN
jgi:hypothetical protein